MLREGVNVHKFVYYFMIVSFFSLFPSFFLLVIHGRLSRECFHILLILHAGHFLLNLPPLKNPLITDLVYKPTAAKPPSCRSPACLVFMPLWISEGPCPQVNVPDTTICAHDQKLSFKLLWFSLLIVFLLCAEKYRFKVFGSFVVIVLCSYIVVT